MIVLHVLLTFLQLCDDKGEHGEQADTSTSFGTLETEWLRYCEDEPSHNTETLLPNEVHVT